MIWKILLIISLIMNVWNVWNHYMSSKVMRMIIEILQIDNGQYEPTPKPLQENTNHISNSN